MITIASPAGGGPCRLHRPPPEHSPRPAPGSGPWPARCPGARHIIHGDLLNHNVLVTGPGISAVIDWGNAAYGDWLYDAAWLLYWWPWYPAWRRIDIRAEPGQHWKASGGLPADLELRLRSYQLHIGLDAMTYNAFTGRFDDLAKNAKQTIALI